MRSTAWSGNDLLISRRPRVAGVSALLAAAVLVPMLLLQDASAQFTGPFIGPFAVNDMPCPSNVVHVTPGTAAAPTDLQTLPGFPAEGTTYLLPAGDYRISQSGAPQTSFCIIGCRSPVRISVASAVELRLVGHVGIQGVVLTGDDTGATPRLVAFEYTLHLHDITTVNVALSTAFGGVVDAVDATFSGIKNPGWGAVTCGLRSATAGATQLRLSQVEFVNNQGPGLGAPDACEITLNGPTAFRGNGLAWLLDGCTGVTSRGPCMPVNINGPLCFTNNADASGLGVLLAGKVAVNVADPAAVVLVGTSIGVRNSSREFRDDGGVITLSATGSRRPMPTRLSHHGGNEGVIASSASSIRALRWVAPDYTDVQVSCGGVATALPSGAARGAVASYNVTGSLCSCAVQFAADPNNTVCSTCTTDSAAAEACAQCAGSTAVIPLDRPRSPCKVCTAGDCCDVSSSQFRSSGTVCRPATDLCDAPESCTGESSSCPSDVSFAPGTVCRAANGTCDVAETCNGASQCPSDAFKPSSEVCRPAAGPCDEAETCSSTSPECPADAFKPNTTVCRPANGACDLADTCTGSSGSCPADVFVAANSTCRPAAGLCDEVETCSGASSQCPADALKPNGTSCRAAVGGCDVGDFCNGLSAQCADAVKAARTVCRLCWRFNSRVLPSLRGELIVFAGLGRCSGTAPKCPKPRTLPMLNLLDDCPQSALP